MTKNISKIAVLSLFAAALVAMPALSRAEGTSTNAPAWSNQTPSKAKKHGNLPFHGNLSAVDAKAMTLTVGTLTLQVTPDPPGHSVPHQKPIAAEFQTASFKSLYRKRSGNQESHLSSSLICRSVSD